MCRLIGCDEGSVKHGLRELARPLSANEKRIREAGGFDVSSAERGRKSIVASQPQLDRAFLAIMTPGCLLGAAGSPMDETMKWSNLSRTKIAEELAAKGFAVSVTVVDQLLEKHDFRRRQAFKTEADKQVEDRDEQFNNIEQLVETARQKGNLVMSMDVKKKS